MDLHDRYECSVQIVCLCLLGVEDVHGVRPARDGEDRLQVRTVHSSTLTI